MTSDAEAKRRAVEEAFGRAGPVYDKNPIFAEPGRRLVDLAELGAGARVLDIASGRGAVLFPAAERVGPSGHVHGIDLAEPMVQATSTEIVSRGVDNADLRKMDAEHIEFANAFFDAVTCGFALWFIPDLKQALSEVRRVLKPGGRFVTSTWAEPPELSRRQTEMLRSYGLSTALGSHSLSTVESLESALRDAGFDAVSAHYMEQTIVFTDEDDWWERSGSSPQSMQDVSAEQIARVKQEALALARSYRGAEGIVVTRRAVLATATSPKA